MNIQDTIQRSLSAAGIGASSSLSKQILGAIDSALGKAFPPDGGSPAPGPAAHASEQQPGKASALRSGLGIGSFESCQLAGGHAYRLYVPASYAGGPVPLVVMLHGCTQDPEDFARGTGMNSLADKHGILVAYPEQPANANGSRCWNWFRPEDQVAGRGEPAWIVEMVGDIGKRYAVRPNHVFVAGLSAGAAMAIILGETYPDTFSAVGAHSGLPYGSATDVASAFAVMKSGTGVRATGATGKRSAIRRLIAFHGDADTTVNPANSDSVVLGVVEATADLGREFDEGRRHTRTRYTVQGRRMVEQWIVRGAGHAWSGGQADGSFTYPTGPDASAAMLRFFLELPDPS